MPNGNRIDPMVHKNLWLPQDSNPRPLELEAGPLTTELSGCLAITGTLGFFIKMVFSENSCCVKTKKGFCKQKKKQPSVCKLLY